MSVSLNKPGLAKLNMKNNSLGSASFKVATANKLSTSTRTGFGIMAQRTKVGSGTIFNVKAYNSDSISANRHALNDNRTIIRNNNFVGVPYHTENNSMNKYAAALAVTSMLAQTLGQLGSLTSSSNVPTNNPKNNGNEKLSASSKDLTSLNAMRKATDSTTLREAIETAKSEQSSMQSELTQLEAQLPSMKEASEAATKQLQDLEPKVSEKEKDVKQKENTVAEKESVLSAAEKDKKSKLEVAKNMEAAVGEAASNYTKASEALVNAEATLASTPETIIGPDGKEVPNEPAYSNAQKAVETAKQQKQEAQTKLDEAKANHEKAVENYETSITAYENAAKDVQNAKDELKVANADLEKAQEELNELKKQESDANSKVKTYENALDKQKQLTSDIKKYEDELKIQDTRLTELEEAENNKLTDTNDKMNSLSDKIDKRNDKIDSTNGLNLIEKFRMKKNEKNSEKYEELTSTRDDLEKKVNYTKLYKDSSKAETIGGKTFRTGSYNGETLYMIGAKPVTEEEFEKAKNAAKQSTSV